MDELLEILQEINPTIDYVTADNLIDGKLLDSLEIVTLVTEVSDNFDIEISPRYLEPKNFNSAEAIWNMIQEILEDE